MKGGELTGPPAALLADSRPVEELYDLQAAPWEIVNLAGTPEFARIQSRLARQLTAWQNEIGDTGSTPETAKEIAVHVAAMKRAYDKKLTSRPSDWFLHHPSLGPYKNK